MALSVDRINGISGDLAIKAPCRVATTAAITLAGFQTIDGVVLADGDSNLRVLVKNQADTSQNGVYLATSGTWSRSTDFNGASDIVKGTELTIQEGTVNGGYFFVVATSDPITIGTSALTFTSSASAAASAVAAAASATSATASATSATASATSATASAAAAAVSAANLPNATTAGASKFLQSDAAGTAWEYKTAAQTRTALSLDVGTDVMAFAASASQAEMEAGTEAALRAMSPLRIAQAIAVLGGGGVQIRHISASVAASALTISASALSLDFRSATLGSGTVTTVSGTPANLVISSGSTLGTTSAVQSRIAVLALNNAGTIELAAVNISGGNNLGETGVISTTAEGGAGAADSASVIYSTTARTNVAYRAIGYIESTQATAGTWATAPSTIQGAGGQTHITGTSMVRLNTTNGKGGTNTTIDRFSNIVANQGSDITYADSAANGASFTINTPGVYSISYTGNPVNQPFGMSLNSTQLTTSIQTITAADALTFAVGNASGTVQQAAVTLALNSGDVIRPHSTTTAMNSAGDCRFTITKVGP